MIHISIITIKKEVALNLIMKANKIILGLLLSFLSNNIKTQMTIFPDNFKTADSYFLDDITNPTENTKYIQFAYWMSSGSSISGYKDEYNGIYYTPNTVNKYLN